MPTLNGGSFNLLFGRNDLRVMGEVTRLVTKWDLDFLNVQEARGYASVLRQVPGYDYYTGSNRRTGVLVREGRHVDRVRAINPGDGWWTAKGAKSGGFPQTQVRIDGWLFNRSIHLPTPSNWAGGRIVNTPPERRDDLIDHMQALRRYLSVPRRRAVAIGDFNEPPSTTGKYSPQWLENRTNSHIYAPRSREGHGRIDWAIAKNVTIDRVFKDLKLAENSDHEPVVALGIRGRR